MNKNWIGCLALASLGLLGGCRDRPEDGNPEGNPGDALDPGPQCVVTDVEITRDEATELGFSADDLLAPIEGTFESILQYRDAGTTDLTITVAHDGAPIHLRDSVPPAGNPDLECAGKSIRAGVVVTFDTADGAFAESYGKTLEAWTAGDTVASLLTDLPTADLQGTWDPGEWTGVSFVVNVVEEGGVTVTRGELTATLQSEEEGASECGFASWNNDGPITGCAE